MPFSALGVYTRFKTFVNGGALLPADLDSIQDELGLRLQNFGLKTGDIKLSALTGDGGWIACDGTPLTVGMGYPNLRNVLITQGSLYGSDGSGNPRVPDMRGSVPVGPDAGASRITSNNALGQRGGEEKHLLSTGELPAHTHDPGGGTHYLTDGGATGTHYAYGAIGVAAADMGIIDPPSAGSTQQHNNLQPYQCLTFLIKT